MEKLKSCLYYKDLQVVRLVSYWL